MSNQYRYKFCGHSPSYLAHFIGNADTQDITYTLYAMHLLTYRDIFRIYLVTRAPVSLLFGRLYLRYS